MTKQKVLLLISLFFFCLPATSEGDFEWSPEFIESQEIAFNEALGLAPTDEDYVHFVTGDYKAARAELKALKAAGKRAWHIQGQDESSSRSKGGLAQTEATPDHHGLPEWHPNYEGKTRGTGLMNGACAEDFPVIKSSAYAKGKLCVFILLHEFKHTSPNDVGGGLVGGAEGLKDPEPCDHRGALYDDLDFLCGKAEEQLQDESLTEQQRCDGLSVICGLYKAAAQQIYSPQNAGITCPGLPPDGYPPIGPLPTITQPVCSHCTTLAGCGVLLIRDVVVQEYGELDLDD